MLVSFAVNAPLPPLVTVPPQLPVRFGGFATTNPAGKMSVNPIPFKVTLVFGLLIVKLNVLLVFNAMLVGLNDLVMVGAAATVRFAVAILPVPPLVELTLPVVLV